MSVSEHEPAGWKYGLVSQFEARRIANLIEGAFARRYPLGCVPTATEGWTVELPDGALLYRPHEGSHD